MRTDLARRASRNAGTRPPPGSSESHPFEGGFANLGRLLLREKRISTRAVALSTVRHAADADYRVVIVGDCCGDRDARVHRERHGEGLRPAGHGRNGGGVGLGAPYATNQMPQTRKGACSATRLSVTARNEIASETSEKRPWSFRRGAQVGRRLSSSWPS
jgi:hypothetical protein